LEEDLDANFNAHGKKDGFHPGCRKVIVALEDHMGIMDIMDRVSVASVLSVSLVGAI
jgi:hypothetical protein